MGTYPIFQIPEEKGMFESASLKHKVDKATFRREEPKLREALLNAQYDLKQKGSFRC
jgi:hypothetical protein